MNAIVMMDTAVLKCCNLPTIATQLQVRATFS